MRDDLVRRVFREMATDGRVVEELVRVARRSAADVAALPEAETRRHVQVLLAAALDFFERAGEPDERHFAAAEALGADRAAQGISIDGLLRGVQAGRAEAMKIAIARGQEAGVRPEAILEAVLDMDRYTGALERHVVNGYHTAELELSRTTRDADTHLLRRLLLHGDTPTPGELRRAGLTLGHRYHCLVSDVSDPGRARVLEQHLRAGGGVFGLVEGRLSGLAARLPTPVPGVLLIAAPAAPLDQVHDIHPLCVAAARLATGDGLHPLTDLAGEIALHAQPVLADLLADTLTGLDHTDDFHRELVATALVHLDQGQRLGHAAAALHVHPNTVRYRLDRLAELTGRPWDDTPPSVLAGLRRWWSLRVWLDRGE
ncbi:helix-turn-helix domain-containing protein [Saccharothrix variisporea]|uniref:PucR-like helix-turn-helix protein n=1 Tax=Saccharothrix variisporea TaxID=543527 RepID=A0A495XLM5_9PSEU|nr:helix-turn-helix domain-containing protein [Saccharothrix variisporea]RKT73784.1 PucR-like helix-turn-helix protein [Saccharothrix variisporea]